MYLPPSLPSAGWYPDPERPGSTRWWDGLAWGPPGDPSAGTTDVLPDIGDMISGGFRRAIRHWRAATAIGVVTAGAATAMVQLGLRIGFDGVVVDDGDVTGWSDDRVPALVALGAGSALLSAIGTLAIVWLMLGAHDTERDHAGIANRLDSSGELHLAGRALVAGAAVLPRAIGWSLLGIAVVVAAIALVVVGGLALVPLGILLALALIPLAVFASVKVAFVLHAVVDRSGNPYGRSFGVSRGRFWGTLGRCLLVLVVTGAINYGISAVASIASGTALSGPLDETDISIADDGGIERFDLSELAPSPWAIVVGSVAAVATTVLVTAVAISALSQLYRTRNPQPR